MYSSIVTLGKIQYLSCEFSQIEYRVPDSLRLIIWSKTFFSFAYIVSNYSTKEIQSVFVVCVKYNMKISPEYTFDDQDVD